MEEALRIFDKLSSDFRGDPTSTNLMILQRAANELHYRQREVDAAQAREQDKITMLPCRCQVTVMGADAVIDRCDLHLDGITSDVAIILGLKGKP